MTILDDRTDEYCNLIADGIESTPAAILVLAASIERASLSIANAHPAEDYGHEIGKALMHVLQHSKLAQ